MVELCVNTWKKKKKNFSSWFNTPRSIRFTIVRSPGIRFNDSFSSGFLSRIKKKKRKKDSQIRFVPFVKIILRYIIDCYEGEKRTNDRDRYVCNKCDCSSKKKVFTNKKQTRVIDVCPSKQVAEPTVLPSCQRKYWGTRIPLGAIVRILLCPDVARRPRLVTASLNHLRNILTNSTYTF